MAETPRLAHLMILLLMGAEFTVVVSLAVTFFGAVARRKMLALVAGCAAVAIAAGYTCVLLGVGWLSGEKLLAPGHWKYFCEADCHIAYSIENVQASDAVPGSSAAAAASVRRVTVRLKTWFDENSIASFRGNGPLQPEPRRVVLEDSSGREFLPLAGAEAASGAHSTPMTQPLRPGESYSTRFVFDVPRDARDLCLLVTDVDRASRMIIDHENSPFHGKILLRLEASADPPYSAER
jgi:hypothetical protein